MSELRSDDLVSVGNGKFEKIIFWSHQDANLDAIPFVVIRTKGGRELRLSECHFTYIRRDTRWQLVEAKNVKPGDIVSVGMNATTKQTEDSDDSLDTVSEVSYIEDDGLYCPHTPSGKIMVEDVLCSCYTSNSLSKICRFALFMSSKCNMKSSPIVATPKTSLV